MSAGMRIVYPDSIDDDDTDLIETLPATPPPDRDIFSPDTFNTIVREAERDLQERGKCTRTIGAGDLIRWCDEPVAPNSQRCKECSR